MWYDSCSCRECVVLACSRVRRRHSGGSKMHAEADDGDLLAAMARGQSDALAALYDRYTGQAFGLAYRILKDPETAADVVQESFLTVWRNAGRYDGERGAAHSWLLRMVYRRCIDQLRRQRCHPRSAGSVLLRDQPAATSVTDSVMRKMTGEAVRRGLMRLPPEQREVIELAYFGGWTQREIAVHLGVPLGTVKGRSRLGLQKLRHVLAEYDG